MMEGPASGIRSDNEIIRAIKLQVHTAAREGKLQRLKQLLGKQLSPVTKEILEASVSGATPLIVAARYGHLDVVEWLVGMQVNIEQVGSVTFDGETIDGAGPLWCAAAAGHIDVVKFLIGRGAQVNATTATNSTPLRAACFDGHFEIVKYLVEHEADIEIANRHGHTCLMIACYKAHLRIAEYLLKMGARHDKRSAKGNTALHDAAESGSVDITRLLLDRGARLERDSYGISPVLAAALAGHQRIVDFLLSLHILESEEFSILGAPSVSANSNDVIGRHPMNTRRTLLVSTSWLEAAKRSANLTKRQLGVPLISLDERVAAIELLGCTYVDKKRDLATAIELWRKALTLKINNNVRITSNSKLIELFGGFGLRELESLVDFTELEANPDLVRLQALLKRERLLGIAHPDTIYFVRYRGAVFADLGRFELCVQLWHYALAMQQAQLEPLSLLVQSSLHSFQELFAYMRTSCRITLPFSDVLAVLECAVRELERSHRAMLAAVPTVPVAARSDGRAQANSPVEEIGRACRAISLHSPAASSNPNPNPNPSSSSSTSNSPEWNFTRLMLVCLNLAAFLLKRTPSLDTQRGGAGAGSNACDEEPDSMTTEQRSQFNAIVQRLVRTPTRAANGFSLLHLICIDQASSPLSSTTTLAGFSRLAVPRAPSTELLRTFLRLRANPNCSDAAGNKPLHIVAQQLIKLAHTCTSRTSDEREADILARHRAYTRALLVLQDGGAHADTVNERGESPISLLRENRAVLAQVDALAKQQPPGATESVAKRWPPANPSLFAALFERETLKCLAARVLRQNSIGYAQHLPAQLVSFVDAH